MEQQIQVTQYLFNSRFIQEQFIEIYAIYMEKLYYKQKL